MVIGCWLSVVGCHCVKDPGPATDPSSLSAADIDLG